MKINRLIAVAIVSCVTVFAQETTLLFPDKLNIQPFTANFLEPRIGFLFRTGQNDLRMDIGASKDIVHYKLESGATISIGADMFTYTKLRGENDFHFPVDAVDYLFGFNAGYSGKIAGYEAGVRVRLSHISTHMVDGHYSNTLGGWLDGRNPIVYSREFIEVFPYIKFSNTRLYAGLTYVYHTSPKGLHPGIYQIGFDSFLPEYKVWGFVPFVAAETKLVKLNTFMAYNTIMAGVKVGNITGAGFSLYYQYYSGRNNHGQYYDLPEQFSAIGFHIDF